VPGILQWGNPGAEEIQDLSAAVKEFHDNYPADDPLYDKAWVIFESSVISETLTGYPSADKLEQIVREELRNCFTGQTSPAQAADAIQKRWEQVMGSRE